MFQRPLSTIPARVAAPQSDSLICGTQTNRPRRTGSGVSGRSSGRGSATWVAAGIGRHQVEVNRWCLEMGGHCRTGLEDNVRWDKNRLAASNAELVKRVADLCGEYGRTVATPKVAREILGLNTVH